MGFYHQIEGFPVIFPIIKFYDMDIKKKNVKPTENMHEIVQENTPKIEK